MSILVGARVCLRPVIAADLGEFVALARDSESLHRGLIFAPTTAAEFSEYLARFDGVNAIGFVVRLNTTDGLVGFVNISHIAPAPDPRGMLGYGGFAATAGHGYVGEAVRLAVGYAFAELRLDRLEADVQPGNAASRKVVELAGFRSAGSAPEAICIAGEWRAHERWVITARQYGSNAFEIVKVAHVRQKLTWCTGAPAVWCPETSRRSRPGTVSSLSPVVGNERGDGRAGQDAKRDA